MPQPIIREAQAGDAESLCELRYALWPEGSRDEHATELREFFAADSRTTEEVFVAVGRSGDLLGFCEVAIRSRAEGCVTDRVGYLEGWYVVPAARLKGVGRALEQAAENWARQRGCTEFASDALVDNLDSAAAHRALGFSEVEVIRCFRKALEQTNSTEPTDPGDQGD